MVLSDKDRALLTSCLNGIDGAWEEFVERYLPLITHAVNAAAKVRCGEIDQQTRDDAVAEVLLTLVDNDSAVLRNFRGQSSLGTYLVVIARRVALRRLGGFPTTAGRGPEPEQHSLEELRIESQDEVLNLLAQMPESEATAIRMFHLEHRSYGDIGDQIGIPANSVGPLLSKARQRMRTLQG